MSTLDDFQYPPPVDWQAFQRFCVDLFSRELRDPYLTEHGRNGQSQDGVDIYGTHRLDDKLVGIQCKGKDGRYGKQLTVNELRTAVDDAYRFEPKLEVFILATSGQKDKSLQAVAREISAEHQKMDLFRVVIFDWVDILRLAQNYPSLVRDRLTPGGWQELVDRDNGRTVSVDDMNIKRRYVLGHSVGNAHTYFQIFLPIMVVMGLFFFLTPISLFWGFKPNFDWMLPVVCTLFISTFIALRANALKKCRFTNSMPPIRTVFFEANANGDIYLTKLDATCPYCRSRMSLRVCGDWKVRTEEIFVCTKNPSQHRIISDYTHLPPVS
ncbi:restriction endonuclease [Undibacterium sp. CY7W]|uniref:Restriction endonuclease n=1 Tax=Undibacterium rugosum TaxID=2762291 RepID=A0A923HXE3_9BURK|nr:restriction endonuclease [Undibacterium rugosum]MBC3933736.1 restriction endonuclease [Undibacterium rugosum]